MKILYCFLFLLFSFNVICQDGFLTKEGTKYYYNGKEYKCKELGPIYEQSEEAFRLYNSGMKYYNTSSVFGTISLLSLGAAVFLAISQKSETAATTLWVSLGVAVASLIWRIAGDENIGLAKEKYNFDMLEKHGLKEPSLSFGQSENRIGFIYTF